MKPLVCPCCGAEVYHTKYGESSFTCFNCESEVYQISLKRTIKTSNYGEKGNSGVRNLESEILSEEGATVPNSEIRVFEELIDCFFDQETQGLPSGGE